MSKFFGFILGAAGLIMISLSACQKNNVSPLDVDYYTENAMDSIHDGAGCGRMGCLEFVYPVTLEFPDGSTVDVNSAEEMKETIKSWREDNPDAEERPKLSFPLDVLDALGNVITVEDADELRKLNRACHILKRHHKRGEMGKPCFKLVFPLSIEFPDGTTAEAADHKALHQLVREWRKANPDAEGRPALIFPVKVTLEDGTEQTVNSKEDLQALKESCKS